MHETNYINDCSKSLIKIKQKKLGGVIFLVSLVHKLRFLKWFQRKMINKALNKNHKICDVIFNYYKALYRTK